ncbi:MAG TPA: LPS export ABC transporter periplasmic protein LptC [Burkholderiaceae bacterium]|nr:LPS export ABC transporter periplasmic protein LptC [Burkholderiaceae bacterium]
MPTPRRLRDWADAAMGYLPMLLMAALAGATWWLVKNTPVPDEPRAERPLRHEPDYTMSRFTVQRFEGSGRPGSFLEGRELRHYPDTDTLEIDELRLRHVDDEGRVVRAVAERGLSNGDGSEIQLFGGAQVVREAGGSQDVAQNRRLEFRGDFLHLYTVEERVVSHLPVTLRMGDMEVHGDRLRYDNVRRVLELQGRVRGTLPPQGARAASSGAEGTARNGSP